MSERAPRTLDFDAVVPKKPEGETVVTKYSDPCKQAALQSMRCLDRNGHDKSKCQDEFLIYRRCKQTYTRRKRIGAE